MEEKSCKSINEQAGKSENIVELMSELNKWTCLFIRYLRVPILKGFYFHQLIKMSNSNIEIGNEWAEQTEWQTDGVVFYHLQGVSYYRIPHIINI